MEEMLHCDIYLSIFLGGILSFHQLVRDMVVVFLLCQLAGDSVVFLLGLLGKGQVAQLQNGLSNNGFFFFPFGGVHGIQSQEDQWNKNMLDGTF